MYERVTTDQSLGIIYTFIRSYIFDAPIQQMCGLGNFGIIWRCGVICTGTF